MAIEIIDTIQSDQLSVLEDDMDELKTKLNLLVNDILAITSKVNQVINDLDDMNDVTMAGYTTPGSPESHGILQSLEDWVDDDYDTHLLIHAGGWEDSSGEWRYGEENAIPLCGVPTEHLIGTVDASGCYSPGSPAPCSGAGCGGGDSGSGGSESNPGGTGQGGNTSASQGSSDASIDGQYGNPFAGGILNISNTNIIRARRLARQTLNRLRK